MRLATFLCCTLCLLVSRGPVCKAWVMPSSTKTFGTSLAGASSGDDLPEIVKAYQKAKKGFEVREFNPGSINADDVAKGVPSWDASKGSGDVSSLYENLESIQGSVESKVKSVGTKGGFNTPFNSIDTDAPAVADRSPAWGAVKGWFKNLGGTTNGSLDSVQDSIQSVPTGDNKAPAWDALTGWFQHVGRPSPRGDDSAMRENLASIQASIQSIKSDIATSKEMLNEGLAASSQVASGPLLDTVQKSTAAITDANTDTGALLGSVNSIHDSLLQMQATLDGTQNLKGAAEMSPLAEKINARLDPIQATLNSESMKDLSISKLQEGIESMKQAMMSLDNEFFQKAGAGNAQESDFVRNAQEKANQMMHDTYEKLGISKLANFQFAIPPVFDDIAALSALAFAAGSKEAGKNSGLRKLVKEGKKRNKLLVLLDEKMDSMGYEILTLKSEVLSLREEIQETESKLVRTDKRVVLERSVLASKLKALRRKSGRMKKRLSYKEQQAEELELQVLQTKKWNMEAVAFLAEVDPNLRARIAPNAPKKPRGEDEPFFLKQTGKKSAVPNFGLIQLLKL